MSNHWFKDLSIRLYAFGVFIAALVASAFGGTYTVTYSQTGTVNIVGPFGTAWSHGYADSGGGRGGGDISSEPGSPGPPPMQGVAGPGSVACSGTITATYTWVPAYPNEPAPKNALVREYSTASYSGDSGACANGLGDAAVGDPTAKTSSGYRLTVKTYPDTASFTTNCGPTASASVAPGGDIMAASASVYYKGEAWPVVVTLSGTKENTSDHSINCLVGQRITATITAGPATLSNWSWTVPGEIFKSFSIQSPSQTYGRVIPVTAGDLLVQNPSWCWKKNATNTVSCTATATLNGKTASVTGERATVVQRPTYSASGSVNNTVIFGPPGTQDMIEAGNFYSTPPAPGMAISASSTTPSFFTSQGAGENCFAQLVKGTRSVTGGSPTVSHNFPDYVLDNAFPYGGLPTWPANGTTNSTDDSPAQGLGNNTSFNIDNTFKMYVLYRPPNSGNGSEWVPLYYYEWNWTTSGTRASSAVAWPTPPSGSVTAIGSGDTTTHPVWEAKVSNGP